MRDTRTIFPPRKFLTSFLKLKFCCTSVHLKSWHYLDSSLPSVCVHVSLQSFPALCNPMDCSLPAPSVHEILQARILEWGAISFSRASSWPRDRTCISYISCIGRQVLYHKHHLESPSLPSVVLCLTPLLFLFFVSLEKICLKFLILSSLG